MELDLSYVEDFPLIKDLGCDLILTLKDNYLEDYLHTNVDPESFYYRDLANNLNCDVKELQDTDRERLLEKEFSDIAKHITDLYSTNTYFKEECKDYIYNNSIPLTKENSDGCTEYLDTDTIKEFIQDSIKDHLMLLVSHNIEYIQKSLIKKEFNYRYTIEDRSEYASLLKDHEFVINENVIRDKPAKSYYDLSDHFYEYCVKNLKNIVTRDRYSHFNAEDYRSARVPDTYTALKAIPEKVEKILDNFNQIATDYNLILDLEEKKKHVVALLNQDSDENHIHR